jgi:hypothetical protein
MGLGSRGQKGTGSRIRIRNTAYDLYDPQEMFLMRADPLQGQVGGGWALEIDTFLGRVKWHRAVRRVPFGAQTG